MLRTPDLFVRVDVVLCGATPVNNPQCGHDVVVGAYQVRIIGMVGIAVDVPGAGDLFDRALDIDLGEGAIGEQVRVIGCTAPLMNREVTCADIVGKGARSFIATELIFAIIAWRAVITLPVISFRSKVSARTNAYVIAATVEEISQRGLAACPQIILNFIGATSRHKKQLKIGEIHSAAGIEFREREGDIIKAGIAPPRWCGHLRFR